MDIKIKVLFWITAGDNESDCVGLEWNLLQLENALWNVMGVDELDWDRKELSVFQYEGLNMGRGRR